MYKCSNCGKSYGLSEANRDILPKEHVIKCPHCGFIELIIGADKSFSDDKKIIFEIYSYPIDDSPIEDMAVIEGVKR